MNFENIKTRTLEKYNFSNEEYLVFGKEFLINMNRAGIDCWDYFENDIFKIVPFDWDGLHDCNCYFDKEVNMLYSNGATDNEVEQYINLHMHDIDCSTHDVNFFHKPTGIAINWYNHIDRFESVNKKINFEEWKEIVQDCVKSVLKENYEVLINKISVNKVIDFGNNSVTLKEFDTLFNKFIKDNGWSIQEDN